MAFLLLIQLVPYGRSHTNPAVVAEPAWDSPETRGLFMRACADCHSNQTTWPWYSNVAPISWLLAHDVADGRKDFNISEWGRPKNKGDEAAKEVRKGEMPPWFYTPLHPQANLTPAERQRLIAGLVATFGSEGNERDGDEGGGPDGDE
jgi:mono/diheme cytochrome c family protein